MKEIKINVSIKRVIFIFLVTTAWLAVMFGVKYHLAGQDYKVLETINYLLCLMILYFVYFFYLGGRRTRLIITDVQLRVNAVEPWVVQLSGVDSFYVDKFKGHTFIGIRYKENTWEAHKEDITEDRKQRSKAAMQGYPYEVYVGGLSMKPQEICDLLNARINQ